MNRIGIIVIAMLVIGCSTLTPQQIQDRQTVDIQNWANCEALLNENGVVWMGNHPHAYKKPHRIYEVRQDLQDAACWQRLGKHWIDHEPTL